MNNNITQEVLQLSQEHNSKLTKQQIEENIIEWCTFYRRNFDIFNEDYLGIKINPTQKMIDAFKLFAPRSAADSSMEGSICLSEVIPEDRPSGR